MSGALQLGVGSWLQSLAACSLYCTRCVYNFAPSPSCISPRLACRGFLGGNVTFVYTISDGVTPVTATVTLIVPPANGITPAVYNYTAPFNADFDGPRSVLDDITSTNPGAQLVAVELISRPNATAVGSIDISPNGSFVFRPVPGWFGEWPGLAPHTVPALCWLHSLALSALAHAMPLGVALTALLQVPAP